MSLYCQCVVFRVWCGFTSMQATHANLCCMRTCRCRFIIYHSAVHCNCTLRLPYPCHRGSAWPTRWMVDGMDITCPIPSRVQLPMALAFIHQDPSLTYLPPRGCFLSSRGVPLHDNIGQLGGHCVVHPMHCVGGSHRVWMRASHLGYMHPWLTSSFGSCGQSDWGFAVN
jgi:hypothetical protein